MSRITLSLTLLAALAVVACDKGDTKAEGAQPDAVELTDEAVDQAPIPVKEDFEEKAQTDINEDNVEATVDALEKEIEGDSI